jgi:hypothetical protein
VRTSTRGRVRRTIARAITNSVRVSIGGLGGGSRGEHLGQLADGTTLHEDVGQRGALDWWCLTSLNLVGITAHLLFCQCLLVF